MFADLLPSGARGDICPPAREIRRVFEFFKSNFLGEEVTSGEMEQIRKGQFLYRSS